MHSTDCHCRSSHGKPAPCFVWLSGGQLSSSPSLFIGFRSLETRVPAEMRSLRDHEPPPSPACSPPGSRPPLRPSAPEATCSGPRRVVPPQAVRGPGAFALRQHRRSPARRGEAGSQELASNTPPARVRLVAQFPAGWGESGPVRRFWRRASPPWSPLSHGARVPPVGEPAPGLGATPPPFRTVPGPG